MIRLEVLRKVKGLTQKRLAKEILYSATHICRIEKEERTPDQVHPRLRKALEDYFGEPIEDILKPIEI